MYFNMPIWKGVISWFNFTVRIVYIVMIFIRTCCFLSLAANYRDNYGDNDEEFENNKC